MMQSGFQDRNGERLEGIREMLEKLRRKRRDELEQYDLGGVYDDIAQELREVVELERDALDEQLAQARRVGRPAPRGAGAASDARNASCSSTCCRPISPAGP